MKNAFFAAALAATSLFAGNQELVTSVFPDQAAWEKTFPVAFTNDACNGKEILSRENFLESLKKYPGFADSGDRNKDIRELAAFLANVSQETTGAAPGKADGGLCFAVEQPDGRQTDYCTTVSADWIDSNPYASVIKANCTKKLYYGRGALQITNPYNYAQASEELYGDQKVLLEDPEKIVEGTNAWVASLNFWMNHEGGLQDSTTGLDGTMTCHDAIGKNNFGKTIEVINGNLECGQVSQAAADKVAGRIRYFETYLAAFGYTGSKGTLTCISGIQPETPTDYRCGADWADANGKCGTACHYDSDCPSGEKCFAGLDQGPCGK